MVSAFLLGFRRIRCGRWSALRRTQTPTDDAADHADAKATPPDRRANDIQPTQRNQDCAYCPQPPGNLISFHTCASRLTVAVSGAGPQAPDMQSDGTPGVHSTALVELSRCAAGG